MFLSNQYEGILFVSWSPDDYHFNSGMDTHKVRSTWVHRPSSWFLSHSKFLSFPEMKLRLWHSQILIAEWLPGRKEGKSRSSCESHTWDVLQAALSWEEYALPQCMGGFWLAVPAAAHCWVPLLCPPDSASPETSATVSPHASCACRPAQSFLFKGKERGWRAVEKTPGIHLWPPHVLRVLHTSACVYMCTCFHAINI